MSITKHAFTINPTAAKRRPLFCAMLALLPALMLAGCGGSNSDSSATATPAGDNAAAAPVTDSAQVDAALEESPCDLASTDMVASLFDVPAAEIESSASMSWCDYTWEGDGKILEVQVNVNGVFEDAESASSSFRSTTRGMSGADLDKAMTSIKNEVASKTADNGKAVDAIMGDTSDSPGIVFEDVEGVGDEARLALTVGAGDLYVRAGNLNFTVAAYSGTPMPRPDGMGIMEAIKSWQKDTMPQRKEAAIKLSKAIIETL